MSDCAIGGAGGCVPAAYDTGPTDLDAGLPPPAPDAGGEAIDQFAFVLPPSAVVADTAAQAASGALRAAGATGATIVEGVETGTVLELLSATALRGFGLLALVTLKGDGPDTAAESPPQVGFPTGPNGERPPRVGFLPAPGETPPGFIVVPPLREGPRPASAVASAGKPPPSGTPGAAPPEAPEGKPPEDGLWKRFVRWLMPSEPLAVRGPSGRRYEALVAVDPNVEVPLRPPEAPFTYTASYQSFVHQVEAAPAMPLDAVLGLRLGQGAYKQVHEFEPEPGWVVAVLRASDVVAPPEAPVAAGPDGMLAATREAVTAARLAAIGLPTVPAHGLVRLQSADGDVRLGIVSDRIDGAIDARAQLREPLRQNAALGRPLASGIPAEVLGALNRQSLADLDRVLDERLARGFRIVDEQYLLDPASGHLLLSDAQGLVAMDDVWGPRDFEASLQFRNRVAELLGEPARAMPDLGDTEFQPWWPGQPSGVTVAK